MTLIAFALYGDSTEIITDTLSYTPDLEILGTTTKSYLIPHLDAAVATQGNSTFGNLAKSSMMQVAGQVTGFDELVTHAPEHLRKLWTSEHMTIPAERREGIVFLVGWSDNARAFCAWYFASDDDFAAHRIEHSWVIPAPWNLAPSDLEWSRFENVAAGSQITPEDVQSYRDLWTSKPSFPPGYPQGFEQWRDLAVAIREQRAEFHGWKVPVAGRVVHQRLRRGSAHTKVIHTFDDQGPGFLRMLRGTRHPIGQLAECWCDSGESFLFCHLAPHLDEPCQCESGKTFRDCCMVQDSVLAELAAAGETG